MEFTHLLELEYDELRRRALLNNIDASQSQIALARELANN